MKRLFMTLLVLVMAVLVISGCGSSNSDGKKANSSSTPVTTAKSDSKNILTDKTVGEEILKSLKEQPDLKGKDLMVFHGVSVSFLKETGSVVTLDILKPGTEKDVDKYKYVRGSWSSQPVRITGNGKMKDNLMPLANVRLDLVADMVKQALDKASEQKVEGAKIESGVLIFEVRRQKQYWNFIIKGTREEWNAEFDINGKLTEFRKR